MTIISDQPPLTHTPTRRRRVLDQHDDGGTPHPTSRHSVADVTEALMGEFGAQLNLSVISQPVLEARHHVRATATEAPADLVEALARHLLLQLTASR